MKLEKASKRDRKINKRHYGIIRNGDSVFLIKKELEKRKSEARKERRKKNDDLA